MICVTYSALLDSVFAASTRYHQALDRLSRLAGRGRPELFRKARLDCVACARDCRRVVAAFNAHQSDHGCGASTHFARSTDHSSWGSISLTARASSSAAPVSSILQNSKSPS
jgi:hypothetical protein